MDVTAGSAALHEDTLIHTGRGLVPAKEIEPGDSAFSLDELTRKIRPAMVTARVAGRLAEVFEVKVGTRTIRGGPDVRFLALIDRRRPGRLRRRFRAEWTRAVDLKLHDIVAVARKTPDLGTPQALPLPTIARDRRCRAVRFPAFANDDLMWWLGLYAGDGYVHNRGREQRCIEFAVPASQADLQQQLIQVSKLLFGVDARPRDKWRVGMPGIRLVDYVEALGLSGTALEKRIPDWVFRSPEAHRLSFLGGYLDADGSIRTPAGRGHNKDMGLTSANPGLLEDARRLAVSCGIGTSAIWEFRSKHPIERDRWMTGYRMQFSGDFDRITCRAAHRVERMRKRKWFHTHTSVGGTKLHMHGSEWLGYVRVESITRAGLAGTWAIQILGATTLVAEGLIIGLQWDGRGTELGVG